ncbi:MAG: hypothetical protein F6K18_26800 [Okeania sp. SIO2C2]|uniref:hypothetical protein n=1 Tax=Okeania sp. SIO2C2 TaxID=2607787 RepID=UPI0013B9E3D4|nr:hypothetical protein [Okeania sp. SIO2C2]NEP90142.1 hypothetical protein [Okeania sp. SIO2C2]
MSIVQLLFPNNSNLNTFILFWITGVIELKISVLLKRVYDINLNYLGVNLPLTPPRRRSQEDRVRREERITNRSRRRKFFAGPLILNDIIPQISNAKIR